MECPECGGRVVYYRSEYVCDSCGLVVEEEIAYPSLRVSDERVEKYTTPGTLLADIQLRKVDRRLKQMVRKEIDDDIVRYISLKGIVDTKELWDRFRDRFKTKTEFYELLRRLRNQKRIKKGYVVREV